MKCKDCTVCMQGVYPAQPWEYVCLGAKYPFIIDDLDQECTEYKEKRTKDCVPKYCYGLVNKDGKLIKYEQSPRLFVVKAFAYQAAEKYNLKYNDNVKVVTFRLECEL